jgi:hypothetical protein
MFGEFKYRLNQGKYILSPYSTQSHTGFLIQLEIRAETSGFDCYGHQTDGALPDNAMHHFDEFDDGYRKWSNTAEIQGAGLGHLKFCSALESSSTIPSLKFIMVMEHWLDS